MTITDYFKLLGAPLNNPRWSWGAVRDDGAVVLRVWAETNAKMNGKSYSQLSGRDWNTEDDNNGFQERKRHIDLVRNGAPCYLVMCQCVDKEAQHWEIEKFDDKTVWTTGELIEEDGKVFIERVERPTVAAFRRNHPTNKEQPK